MNLLQQTQYLIEKSQLNDRQIAEGAGLGAKSTNWVNKIRRDQIPSPGIHKIEKLHDFLTSRVVSSVPFRQASKLAKANSKKQARRDITFPESRVRKNTNRAQGIA